MFGNTTTTYRDSYGNQIGTSRQSTDMFGNTTSRHSGSNSNTQIWTW